ncbi:MAG: hypothetical protein NTY33_00325 [Candidatus Moranbacteria bacterium]|nr:hypothetical protein [Candidatus Moranbacteria bacterium]
MKKASFYFCLLFFLSLAFLSQRNSARAQDAQPGFLIDPFFQSVDVQKGQTSAQFSVKVKNTTISPAVFRVSVLDFGTLNESGGVAFLGASDNLKYGLASWVSLPNDTLVLAPGEEQTIRGTIENRESLAPGGHYGAVFLKVEDNNENVNDNNKKEIVAFDPSLASLLFVRKIGGEIYGLNLKSFDFAKSFFSLPDQIKLRFQNTGNVHIIPYGTAEVLDPFGRQIAKSIINNESGIILPETFRVFSAKFISITPAFIPGHYTLLLNYRYDGKDDFESVRSSFFLIPPNFVILIIFLIALSVATRFFFREKK